MEQPSDFVAQGRVQKVCRLKKSLYELKQSPRAWFEKFTSVVQEFGLLWSQKDHYVFFQYQVNFIVYVDHIVITSNDTQRISEQKLNLQKKFQTKDLR